MPSLGGTNENLISQQPWLEVPKNIGSAYQKSTQPIQGILDPYNRGITDSVLTRNATNDLITAYGNGQRQQIDQDFATRANNAAGGLAARGFGGSSLQITTALGVERDRKLAQGNLEDRIIQQRLGNSLNYAQLIAQQTGQSGDASTSLMRTLLGLTQSTRAPNSGGGGGGGGGQSPSVGDGTNDVEDAYNNLPPLTNPFLPGGGGVSGGGTRSGGGGGGGSSGGGGGGQVITNPFLPPGGGGNVTEGSDIGKKFPPIPPTGPIPLIPDQGPRLTPEEYAENQKRLAQAKAEGRTTTFGNYVGDVNPGDPGQV